MLTHSCSRSWALTVRSWDFSIKGCSGFCWGNPIHEEFPMAAASNSLTSGETSAFCWCWDSSSPSSPGQWAGTTPAWAVLVSNGDPRAHPHRAPAWFGHPILQLCPCKPYEWWLPSPLLTLCDAPSARCDRRAHRASRLSPGAGDVAAGGRCCGKSGGRRRGW